MVELMKKSKNVSKVKKLFLVISICVTVLSVFFIILYDELITTDEESARETVLAFFHAVNNEDAELCCELSVKEFDAVAMLGDYIYEVEDITYEPNSLNYAVIKQRMEWEGYSDNEWIYLQISFRPFVKENVVAHCFEEGYLYQNYGIWLIKDEKKWKILEMGY